MKRTLLLILASGFIGVVLSSEDVVVFPCVTPNGESAYCLSLFSCPLLMNSLSTLNPRAVDYVKKSVCSGNFMVCCGTHIETLVQPTTATVTVPITPTVTKNLTFEVQTANNTKDSKEARRNYVKNKLLPSQNICGHQHTDDRVYTGNETALDEFPWVVHHYMTNLTELDYEYTEWCTGVLINNRYVLTDAWCAAETIKLGQYSTYQNTTCVEDYHIRECTDPIITRLFEKRIRSGKLSNGPYDLTLIRLNQTVTYSEYIRPICLPINGSNRPASETSLIFSGWGSSGDKDFEILKKRRTYDLKSPEVCYKASPSVEGNVKFANVSFFCLEPPLGNNDSACLGEHGGPIMYKYKHKWFADGIIVDVFVADAWKNRCSSTSPLGGIFIDETMMNWILDNIED